MSFNYKHEFVRWGNFGAEFGVCCLARHFSVPLLGALALIVYCPTVPRRRLRIPEHTSRSSAGREAVILCRKFAHLASEIFLLRGRAKQHTHETISTRVDDIV